MPCFGYGNDNTHKSDRPLGATLGAIRSGAVLRVRWHSVPAVMRLPKGQWQSQSPLRQSPTSAVALSARSHAIAQGFAVSAEAERGRSSAERGSGKANRAPQQAQHFSWLSHK